MNKIPNSVPVFIQDLKSNENYSTAKLKVFYVGETEDHRLFTREFSDKILETLPSTPVVGFFSEEDDDFIGHNSVQYVYGHVPETAEISYEKDEDSGNIFAITDVILYTEREDNIGKVAKKIVGKQHSLELNPKTLKYKINRDRFGHMLNIEFIDGGFIGLSVLGDNETPAFTGSGFFTTNEDFKTFAARCNSNFDNFLSYLNNRGGQKQVFNSENFFSKTVEFLAKTMQEFQSEIYRALEEMGTYGWIVENTTEYAIISTYDEEQKKPVFLKYTVSSNEDKLSLENPVEVYVTYLTSEEIKQKEDDAANANSNTEEINKEEEEVANAVNNNEDDDKTDCNNDDGTNNDDNDDKEEEEEDEVIATAKSNTEEDVNPVDDEDKENDDNKEGDNSNAKSKPQTDDADDEQQEEEEEEVKVGNATASSSSTALSDAEREELEQYRRTAKINLINSYTNDLSQELLNNYIANVDSFDKETLEIKLALEFRKYSLENHKEIDKSYKQVKTFATISQPEVYDPNNIAMVVKKYK